MKNKLLFVLVPLLLLIMIALLFYFNQGNGVGEETIKIGVVLPLTGNHADQGEASQNAIQLAVEKVNSQEGINGKKLEPIFENSECEAQKAVTAINKLVNIDGVKFVIGDICSSATLAIIPIAEENKVLLLNAGTTSSAVRDAGDYVFRFWFSGEAMGRMIAEKANEMGIKKVAIIYLNNDFGDSLEKDFSQRFEELGGTVVSKQGVETTNNDFRTELTNAEEKEIQYHIFDKLVEKFDDWERDDRQWKAKVYYEFHSNNCEDATRKSNRKKSSHRFDFIIYANETNNFLLSIVAEIKLIGAKTIHDFIKQATNIEGHTVWYDIDKINTHINGNQEIKVRSGAIIVFTNISVKEYQEVLANTFKQQLGEYIRMFVIGNDGLIQIN